MSTGAIIVGNRGGVTVIVLETGASARPQASVAVQVSVIVPTQPLGAGLNVEGLEIPVMRQEPSCPLLNTIVLGVGINPHATVTLIGAVIVGNVAGETVIVLETGMSALPQASVAVQVSVITPPQPLGAGLKVDKLEIPIKAQPPL